MGVNRGMRPEDDRGHRINTLRNRARAFRRNTTEAERELWWHLRRKMPLSETHFRRQVPLGPFVADFACLTHRLIVELDGSQHARDEAVARDAERSAYLAERGFRVLRFWNGQIFTEIDQVLDTILAALADHPHPPTPPLKGEGRAPRGA